MGASHAETLQGQVEDMSEKEFGRASSTERRGTDPTAVVRHYYELVDAGDVAALVELFTPDAVYHRPGYEPLRGHSELLRFYEGERVIESGRHEISQLIAVGREAAVHGVFDGVLHSGERVSLRFADFFDVTEAGTFSGRRTFFYAPLV